MASTMSVAAPTASRSSPSSSRTPITCLNDNDVKLGRGTGPNNFIGNQRFRHHVETRRAEYLDSTNKDKKRIAREVVNHIHSLGGRFLRQVKRGEREGNVFVNGLWYEEDDAVANEKCKQSLREKVHRQGSKELKGSESIESDSTSLPCDVKQSPHSLSGEHASVVSPPPSDEDLFKHAGFAPVVHVPSDSSARSTSQPFCDSRQSTVLDPRPVLFHQGLAATWLPPAPIPIQTYRTLGSLTAFHPVVANVVYSSGLHQHESSSRRTFDGALREACPDGSHPEGTRIPVDNSSSTVVQFLRQASTSSSCTMPSRKHTMTDADAVTRPSIDGVVSRLGGKEDEDEAAAFLLSSLAGEVDRPTITDEQLAQERASLTNEERAAALADLFGALHLNKKTKRARRGLDRESINFLVGQMKLEIARIPEREKCAMMEAQTKCKAYEFSDERLETFLRCDGMNAERAASRFVSYWEKRKELFGPQKFVLSMTLSEALQDDLVALERSVFCLLPHKDLSGRQIVYFHPHRHTREGYSSESMLRAIWYVAEVASQDIADVGSRVVAINWDRDASLWDYDPKVMDGLTTLFERFLPIRSSAIHSCCTPKAIVRVGFPITRAIMGKEVRSRFEVHDVPQSEIIQVLAEYGITRDMLPTVMGGTVVLNQSEWLAARRALEMEEI